MGWFISKFIYQVICGDGQHTAQFDEQWRLISASSYEEALLKSKNIGSAEEAAFLNVVQQSVYWKFINVSELYFLDEHVDGAEILSRIMEVQDAEAYRLQINRKAGSILEEVFIENKNA